MILEAVRFFIFGKKTPQDSSDYLQISKIKFFCLFVLHITCLFDYEDQKLTIFLYN